MTVVLIWCFTFGIYLGIAGDASVDECAAGMAVALVMTIWALLIRRSSPNRFAASLDLVRHLLRAVGDVPRAAMQTGVVLFRTVVAGGTPGRAHRDPFRFGHDDASDRSRRAVAVLSASLAPDRFVVSVNRDDEVALMHDIVRRDHDPDPRWLE
jgi:hypothetical protein